MTKTPDWSSDRLQVYESEYWPAQLKMFPRLLVVACGPGGTTVQFHRLANTTPGSLEDYDNVIQDLEFDLRQVSQLHVHGIARQWIKRSYNVVFTKPGGGNSAAEHIQDLVDAHFEKYRTMFRGGELKPVISPRSFLI